MENAIFNLHSKKSLKQNFLDDENKINMANIAFYVRKKKSARNASAKNSSKKYFSCLITKHKQKSKTKTLSKYHELTLI